MTSMITLISSRIACKAGNGARSWLKFTGLVLRLTFLTKTTKMCSINNLADVRRLIRTT